MSSIITVHHPAGVVDLGHGLSIDMVLRRDALGGLLHARVPVFAGEGAARKQVGTAVMNTYRPMTDGTAVDLEFTVDLDDE